MVQDSARNIPVQHPERPICGIMMPACPWMNGYQTCSRT